MNKQDLDLVTEYAKKFVDAVAPAAKQAYEVGLVTLQIDAAQSLLFGLLALAFITVFVWVFVRKLLPALKKAEYLALECEGEMAATIFGGLLSLIAAMVAFVELANIWNWVKLVNPQLWLVHQAIEKIIK